MELNADLSHPALVHAGNLPWVPSPATGVERRMLFRIGGEQAVATSIVRYAPRSSFPMHVHTGGEEFLVLDGVFEDENGEYSVGSYVRNPPGSRHAPRSSEGCVIFVRLRQFRKDDGRHVVSLPPKTGHSHPRLEPRVLFEDFCEHVAIFSWDPHEAVTIGPHGGLELLVVRGQLSAGNEYLEPWSWLRLPPGMPLAGTAGKSGCAAWVKTAAPRK